MTEKHDLEANRDLVLRFYRDFVDGGDMSLEKEFLGDTYVQHSTMAGDGIEGLKDMISWVGKEWPNRKATWHQTICEGDKVVVQTHLERWPGDPGLAAIDIFRVENGKVVEHWDVIQEIPADLKHKNGMF